jgi:hypothetical protein
MTKEQKLLAKLLKKAVNAALDEIPSLFITADGTNRVGLEQAFVFRVGVYLNASLRRTRWKKLTLDSEYNKNMKDSKRTPSFTYGIQPDLILHERLSNGNNILVVEFKGHWSQVDPITDTMKLKELTTTNGVYGFQLGVFVVIEPNNAKYTYIINGNEYE